MDKKVTLWDVETQTPIALLRDIRVKLIHSLFLPMEHYWQVEGRATGNIKRMRMAARSDLMAVTQCFQRAMEGFIIFLRMTVLLTKQPKFGKLRQERISQPLT